MVVDRASAEDPGMAAAVAGARFVYLAGGSPLHLRAVLKKSAVFEALRGAYAAGAVVAGAGAGAMVLTDPMVDPRGGALTLGLGLVDKLAVVPHFGDEHDDAHGQKLERTVAMAPAALPVVALPARTALIRDGDGAWRSEGAGTPVVFVGGAQTEGLGALPAAEAPERRQSFSSIVTLWITTCSVGVPERVPRASIVSITSSPLTTSPKREYSGGRRTPSGPLMTKNWLPLVLGPALAMASEPTL